MPQSEPVSRRGLVARLAAAGAAGFTAFRAGAALAAGADVPRVAYHLSDKDKVQFVLGNIEYVDRLDREKSWTSQDRLRLFDGSVAVALAAARDLENSPQFDLRIWEKHLSDLKSGHRPARTV